MHITTRVQHKENCVKVTDYRSLQECISPKESCVKVAEYISHEECIIRKVVLKLQNAYHIKSATEGKLC